MNPITRQEIYLNAIAGDGEVPSSMEPLTREEYYLSQILERVDQMAQNGGFVFVNFTETSGTWTADKTITECLEAWANGKTLVGYVPSTGDVYQLTTITESNGVGNPMVEFDSLFYDDTDGSIFASKLIIWETEVEYIEGTSSAGIITSS